MSTPKYIIFLDESNKVTPTRIDLERCYKVSHKSKGEELQKNIAKSEAYDDKFGLIFMSSKLSHKEGEQAPQGLLSSLVKAYNSCHNLELRLDDVW